MFRREERNFHAVVTRFCVEEGNVKMVLGYPMKSG